MKVINHDKYVENNTIYWLLFVFMVGSIKMSPGILLPQSLNIHSGIQFLHTEAK